jgi:hypothetical protein
VVVVNPYFGPMLADPSGVISVLRDESAMEMDTGKTL